MASIIIRKQKNENPKHHTEQDVINEILYLKSKPMTDINKLKIQRLQQKLGYL